MAGGRSSKMVEDYLRIIWKAEEWPDGSVSTNEIAAILAVTPSSVSANLKKLARDGFIDYEPYGSIALTPAGRGIAVRVVRRHRVLETYLVERLGFGWDEVHPEADALEHAVSDLVLDRMDEVLDYPGCDPHGDPIPRADGSLERRSAARLSEIDPGDEGPVVRIISDHEPGGPSLPRGAPRHDRNPPPRHRNQLRRLVRCRWRVLTIMVPRTSSRSRAVPPTPSGSPSIEADRSLAAPIQASRRVPSSLLFHPG